MCRLFGFRSVINSQVHRSLVSADNALGVQSRRHPDGWGVAYYVGGAPHLIKSADQAMTDQIFQRVSGVVASDTVVAHIRRATQGSLSPLNSHPFQFGRWIFAHNGNVTGFATVRAELLARVHPTFRRFVLGETDSELLFYLVLTHLERRASVHQKVSVDDLAAAAVDAVAEVVDLVGPICPDPLGDPNETYLTFIVTNGEIIVGHQGGKPLFYSTYKRQCPDRDACPSFSAECERATVSGFVNHLVLSSEPLHGENIWLELEVGQLVGVDERMRLRQFEPGGSSAA
ncbi:MAG: class II glutamine amidotransferase [Myxococcales bacterium]|nr:class II glutamine amidotransferase [Myxococcales bacterium]MCB9520270.1 class II glutamine amidotransferase [Myxococcales bacterium]MCB9531362.1 class II glutamine amidotransferase [Myxococcales bacterium]MCB9533565.1 class II glutamine amidotransferase [Myxococcales bacterium]